MKNNLRLTFLLITSFITQITFAQLTRLAANKDLSGIALNANTAVLFSEVDQTLWTTNGTPAGTVQFTGKVNREQNGGTVVMGGKIYFAGTEANNGAELWVTDGTDAGTTLIKDINTGTDDSSPDDFFVFNNQLLFFAKTPDNGYELWKSDGTPGGTVPLKDINPGTADSKTDFTNFFIINGVAVFTAEDADHGKELWKTDGTPNGTMLLKDINGGTGDAFTNILGLPILGQQIQLGNNFFFSANDGTGAELWKTDGTTNGTVKVKDINSGPTGGSPTFFRVFNNKIFFSAFSLNEGQELWSSDGTENGTTLVKDINPGTASSEPNLLFSMQFGNRLLFAAADVDNGMELWSTDGTGPGTTLLKDINPGTEGSGATLLPGFNPNNLGAGFTPTPPFNGKAFLVATTANEGLELWITDGTANGTVLVKDVNPGTEDGVNGSLFYTQEGAYFTGNTPETGAELWKTDGTGPGTVIVQDINQGTGDSDPNFGLYFNNHLYFNADDGLDEGGTPDFFILDAPVTLPITLFNFAATAQTNKSVKLTWSTENEINSSHFGIERSTDGRTFHEISKVKAAGNSSLLKRYEFIDGDASHLSAPVLYYRLRLVDLDASSKYSQVLPVRFKDASFRFALSPNPVRDRLSVVVAAGNAKKISLRITDATGKQVYQQALSATQDVTQQNINVAGLQKGIYYIQLITDKSSKTQQFVKQ